MSHPIHPLVLETIAAGGFPIKHVSPSSISEFAGDQRMFFKKYIRYEFDNTSNPSFLAGSCIHKAAEKAVALFMETGEIAGVEQCKEWGRLEYERKLSELKILALKKVLEDRGGVFVRDVSFMRDWTDEEVAETYAMLPDLLSLVLEEGETFESIVADHELDFLDLGKTGSLEAIQEMVAYGCSNFANWHADDCKDSSMRPRGVEVKEVVYFKDEDGVDMPIPLKGILDRWDETTDGGVVVRDYKSVDRFSEDEEYKYEMAAGAYFFVVQAISGKIPKAIEYIEIMKKEPKVVWLADPARKMLQADLKEEATKAGLEFGKFVKNAELEEMLTAKGLMGKSNPVRVIRIDYTEKAYVVNAFLYMYKAVLNQLAFTDMFLPNLRGWQAKEAWDDLIEEVEGGRDWMEQVREASKARAEAAEKSVETFEF